MRSKRRRRKRRKDNKIKKGTCSNKGKKELVRKKWGKEVSGVSFSRKNMVKNI